ncbi:MAG: type I secretion C-terminal target domain-containing protein [Neomegalonema sp.]|nr:type I secretion C-terminal target domain-containing protein [Neomegalonema sp.]
MASTTAHGYASLDGGTDGGAGGVVVTVTNGYELQAAINRDEDKKGWLDPDSDLAKALEGLDENDPITIVIDGTITTDNSPDDRIEIKGLGNVTLVGAGDGAEFDGIGLKIRDAEDVIVQNLEIHHVARGVGDGDAISIESSSNIWIDHNEFYAEDPETSGKEDYDGLVDIKKGSSNITVSNNYFHDNYRAMMINHNDSDIASTNITINNNVFDNIVSRTPLIRGGDAHVYNNVYQNMDHEDSTGINSRMGADVLVENNYFNNVQNPLVSVYSSETGSWKATGNVLENITWTIDAEDGEYVPSSALETDPDGSSYDLSIPYSYSAISADGLDEVLADTVGTGNTVVADVITAAATSSTTSTTATTAEEDTTALDAEGTDGADDFFLDGSETTAPVLEINGSEGDTLDISALLSDEALKIPSQFLRFTRAGAQAQLQFNSDGVGNDFETIATVTGEAADETLEGLIEAGRLILGEDATPAASSWNSDEDSSTSVDWGPEASDNTVSGTSASEVLSGDAQDNQIMGEGGADILRGLDGSDVIEGGDGRDAILGGEGNDWLDGGDENDTIAAGNGADIAVGGAGDDIILGGAGDDVLSGGTGNDAIAGGAGADFLEGDAGNDRVVGGAGNDMINGGAGDDLVAGAAGNDIVSGGSGNDRVFGGTGNDTLNGASGNDRIFGGAGDDRITGGEGVDIMMGGEGADSYVFDDVNFGDDRVVDFEDGIDSIDISSAVADSFEDLTISQEASNTVIVTSEGTITLVGVESGLIDDTDFNFI